MHFVSLSPFLSLSDSQSHLPLFWAYQSISVHIILGMWKTGRRPVSLIWPLKIDCQINFSFIFAKYRYAYPYGVYKPALLDTTYRHFTVHSTYITGSDSLALRICITTISSSFTSSNFDPFGATKPCAESGSRTRFALLVSISCRVYCMIVCSL